MKHINGFLATPSLWSQSAFGLSQFEMPSINLSTFIVQPIPSKLRLGHQIEFIFKQLLDHTERYAVLAHNIQILRGKNTIGELDFIVEDRFRESKKIHIELTYKFYILDDTIKEPLHRLIGPNRKDSFFTKMEKTRDKQLPLVFTPEGRATLSAFNINPDELEQQTYFLAQVFKPYGQLSTIIEPLDGQCIVGYWIRMENFDSSDFKPHSFYITLKNEWLHEPHLERDYINHKNVLKLIADKHINKRAPLLWIKKDNNVLEKCFVVWW